MSPKKSKTAKPALKKKGTMAATAAVSSHSKTTKIEFPRSIKTI